MGHLKLKGKDLLKLGYPGRSVTKAIAVMQRLAGATRNHCTRPRTGLEECTLVMRHGVCGLLPK